MAIVGSGLSGLAAADRLNQQSEVNVTVFERGERYGGVVDTVVEDGFLIEQSADMFVTDPNDAVQFCRRLGLEDQLVAPNSQNRFSSIVRNGKLIRTPAGFSLLAPHRISSILKSPLLSVGGKLRFLGEYFLRPVADPIDESLESFATRHFGKQFFENIVQPIVAGIYSADASRLSMQATLNRFVEMERRHGSLIRAAKKENQTKQEEQKSSGARYGMFVTMKNGMKSLVDAVVDQNPSINWRPESVIQSIGRDGESWKLTVNESVEEFDAVILATSAQQSAKVLHQTDVELCSLLSSLELGSLIVVTIACRDENFVSAPPQGFGFVVPKNENFNLIACSFSSNKFSGRAPMHSHLMRAFINPSQFPEVGVSSSEWISRVVADLEKLIGFRNGPTSQFRWIDWSGCMPQYHVGHLDRIKAINERVASLPGLELCGSNYNGVGIPACIKSGIDAADKLF